LARKLEIDIAIDLNGHTKNSRTGIFSLKIAPIQISYLGYLGTMGARYYDYIIADKIIVPEELQVFYTEKILYLPTYQVNNHKIKQIYNNIINKDFIFCSMNNNYKITPQIYKSWIEILEKVPKSKILIYVENQYAEENLKKESVRYSLNKERLIFCYRVSRGKYLERFKTVDLFLDTYPYNGGTTVIDALAVGTPVLTIIGNTFASRQASSILKNIDMDELVCKSTTDYVNNAVHYALNPIKLIKIKEKLLKKINEKEIFNVVKFTREYEKKILEIYHMDDSNPK